MNKFLIILSLLFWITAPAQAAVDKEQDKGAPTLSSLVAVLVETEKQESNTAEDSMIRPNNKIKKRRRMLVRTVLKKE